MVLVESSLNSEQASQTRPTYIEKLYLGTDASGLNSEGGLNFEWSLQRDFTLGNDDNHSMMKLVVILQIIMFTVYSLLGQEKKKFVSAIPD